jgi:DNA-binding ferritin-like protein
MNISSKVKFLLEVQLQVKINHWQTRGYARHKAFNKLYEELGDLIDTFVETAMGKYGRFTLEEEDTSLSLVNLSDLDIKSFMKTSKEALIQFTREFEKVDTDLMNIRDNILGTFNQISYLLTLE